MSKKLPRAKFYSKADYLLARHTPMEVIHDLVEDYEITIEEVDAYLKGKTKSNAINSALVTASRQEQVSKYNTIDKLYINSFPNLVTYRLGENTLFYSYTNGVYKFVSDTDMENDIDSYMEILGLLEYRNNRKHIKDTIARIASSLSRIDGRHFSDTDNIKRKFKLNLKNGLLNMETLKIEPHDPKYFSTVQMSYEYNPEAICPKFDKFIMTVSNQDESTKEMMQDMFGYCLADGNPKHKVFYLYGDTARNGKSTTAKILCGLLGSDNYSTLSLAQLAGESSSILMRLIGKQVNFSDEISSKYIESSMLTTISAEGIIEINPKFKSPFTYQVKSKFIITCNDLPKFQNGQGMKHRMITIPFEYQIPENERVDRFDEILLEEEGSGILNWAIKGLLELRKKKAFSINEKSKEDIHENLKESNSVYAFMYDYFDYDATNEDRYDKIDDMYTPYKAYCVEMHTMARGYQGFCIELRRFANETKLIEHKQTGSYRYYTGIKLKDKIKNF